MKGQGNVHGITVTDTRRYDEQKYHTGCISIIQEKKNPNKQTKEEMVVKYCYRPQQPRIAIISAHSCILFLSKPGNTDHSYIIFLMLHLLNNDQTTSYTICASRIHLPVSLTTVFLFSCLHGLCCTRHTNCKGHNQALARCSRIQV